MDGVMESAWMKWHRRLCPAHRYVPGLGKSSLTPLPSQPGPASCSPVAPLTTAFLAMLASSPRTAMLCHRGRYLLRQPLLT